jgi:EmrB/QacA subfamily drug resistance transporter
MRPAERHHVANAGPACQRAVPPAGAGPAAHPWLTLCTVSLGLMMVLLDTSIVSVANPTIGNDLHASLASLQWVTSAFLLAIATGLVTGGKLGDRYGRRRLFTLGATGFALASAGCGLSASITMLIGFRVAQGLAGAAMMPQTLATLRSVFSAERFQLAVGIYVGVSSLAIASGPVVGGVLVQDVDWQSIFFINVVIGAVVVAAARAFMAESSDPRSAGFDAPGALILAGMLFCLVWAVINAGSHGWASGYIVGFLAAAAALCGLWGLRMARARTVLVPLALFRIASFDAGMTVITAVGFTMFGILFYMTLYLQRVQGHGPIAAGAYLLPLTVLSGLAAPAGGALAHRIPLRAQLSGGLALAAAGAFGLTGLTPGSPFRALWPWFVLIGTGVGVSLTGGSQALVGSAPPGHAGIATGIQQTSLNVGGALATAILGSVVTGSAGSVLPAALAHRHLPPRVIQAVVAAKASVAQGMVPATTGLPRRAAHAVAQASHQAVTDGMHTAFLVIGALALAASLASLAFVTGRPGDH